jgi:Family of unknown function (DUF5682)
MSSEIRIFGIRHHGPACARSLVQALNKMQPDIVLIEGPQDAGEIIPLAIDKEMKPPVSLLVYVPDKPSYAVYYPFAEFSPEWQALHYALTHEIPARFMDLPMSMQFAAQIADDEKSAAQEKESLDIQDAHEDDEPPSDNIIDHHQDCTNDDTTAEPDKTEELRNDPLHYLAVAAGYSDSERWWDHMVESRLDVSDLFSAILEAMQSLRENETENDTITDVSSVTKRELLREAYMRHTIRSASKEGYTKIAVVCGAWHAPVLHSMPAASKDTALLKGIPKVKTTATWIPWTNDLLTIASGYGAGISAPGWYYHLWHCGQKNILEARSATLWLSTVAHALRDEGIDVSPGHVIEAVRTAETLAAMRSRHVCGLAELMEAAQSVICHGDPVQLALINKKVLTGTALGQVPQTTPMLPLQKDLAALQKQLRMPPETLHSVIDLDLRKEKDLAKSHLLHRLTIIDIPWGTMRYTSNKTSTFHEIWDIEWHVEFVVKIIEASRYGNSVKEAAVSFIISKAATATLPELSAFVRSALTADLDTAVVPLLDRIKNESALSSDISLLMDALVPLAETGRYGNVRKTDSTMVLHILGDFVERITAGLVLACGNVDNDEASKFSSQIRNVTTALVTLSDQEHLDTWYHALFKLTDLQSLHGVLCGSIYRILRDNSRIAISDVVDRLTFELSRGAEPSHGAAWIEGFLQNSGLLLLHNEKLLECVNQWIGSIKAESFQELLPLIRRTFSTFTQSERQQLGRIAAHNTGLKRAHTEADTELDHNRAQQVFPVLELLLGLTGDTKHE